MQLEAHQASTQAALSNLKSKLDTIPSGLDTPFQRNTSSTSVRSMSPEDAVSMSPPWRPANGNSSVPPLITGKSVPASPSVSASTFALPSDKKDDSGTREHRGSFDHSRGNWGNRIVLTTYPGQANVDPFPLDWYNPDPHLRGPSTFSPSHRV